MDQDSDHRFKKTSYYKLRKTSHQIITESNSSTNSFSTSKQKGAFLQSWYPNGVPIGDRVAESMSLTRVAPRNFESLNTDSDISELADFEHADIMPVNENIKAGSRVASANHSLGLDGSKSISTRENVALISTSLTRSQVNDLEVITGTRLSLDMESMTLSDGKLMNQNVGTLWQQLMKERKDRHECLFLLEQLQENYDVLLQKYAKAENIIDVFRIQREIEEGDDRPLVFHGSQMARLKYADNDRIGKQRASTCTYSNSSQASHRNRGHRKLTTDAKHRRSVKEDEPDSGAACLSSAHNSPNTNLAHKPSMISIQLRANCLKDQINFTKMAMEEQSESIPQNKDVVREFKANLELLKQDYLALRTFGKNCSLEANIMHLQSSLKELESSLRVESDYSDPRKTKVQLTSISNESRKRVNQHSTYPQSARQIVWPPPPTLVDGLAQHGSHRQPASSSFVYSGNKNKQDTMDNTNEMSRDNQSIVLRNAVRVPLNNDMLTSWSIPYFGKLQANMFIDKTVQTIHRKDIQNEQNPNFSLCRSSTASDWHPVPATDRNSHTDSSKVIEDSHRSERSVKTVPLGFSNAKLGDGLKHSENASPSSDKHPAGNTHEAAIWGKRREVYQTGNTVVQPKNSKKNLLSKEENIAKMKALSKLQLAEKKAQHLHRKSFEILSHIYAQNDSKHPPKVYY